MASKPERRTASVMMRLRPSIKALAWKRAREEGRTLSNYVERLIEQDAKRK